MRTLAEPSLADEGEGRLVEEAPAEPPPPPRLSIDLAWYERSHRSLAALLASRLCGDDSRHKSHPASDGESDLQVDGLLEDIERCCSKRAGFVTPRTPVLEAVFRAILANGNRPLAVPDLRRRLMGWLAFHEASPVIAEERLLRLVHSENFYGIREARP